MLDPNVWGTVSDWFVVATALFGVVAGIVQLRAVRMSSHETVQLERAKLLLDLDRDFEGEVLLRSRQRILVVRNRIEQEVADVRPALPGDRQREEIARRFAAYVTGVWTRSREFDGDPDAERDSASDEYMTLMRLPYWCETVGHQCRRNLLPLGDILSLYDQLIIFTIGNIVDHIKVRAESGPHRNSRYLENAVWLYSQACEHKARAERPIEERPSRSRIRWG